MQNSRYDYSSTHVEVPDYLAKDIITWGRNNVGDDDIFVSFDGFSYGREDEIHVTVLYGIHSESSTQLRSLLTDQGPIHVELGSVKVFSNRFKYDVLVIEVYSSDLKRLNQKLAENLVYTDKYNAYNPHVTIAFVKKGKGWKHHGLDIWNGKSFTTNEIVFSSKNGAKERIVL